MLTPDYTTLSRIAGIKDKEDRKKILKNIEKIGRSEAIIKMKISILPIEREIREEKVSMLHVLKEKVRGS